MSDHYTKTSFHPQITTGSTKHTEASLTQLYQPNMYLQDRPLTGTAVTGAIVEVWTDPALQIWAKIDGAGGRYTCTLPSTTPTSGSGKSVSIPTEGQRFSGVLAANSSTINITSFAGRLANCGEEGTEIPLKPSMPGDTKIKTGGKFSPEITLSEDGTMLQRAGNSASSIIDGVQGKQISTFKEAVLMTNGNVTMREYKTLDPLVNVSHAASYLFCQEKYKDLNFTSDKYQDTETPILLPGLTPYIDKTVIRSGYIKGENPIEDLGHIYEIRTQQSHTDGYNAAAPIPMTATLPPPAGTGRSCITELKLGKQKDNQQYGTTRPGGEVIAWRAKDFYTNGWPGAPNPQTHLFRFGKINGEADLFTLRTQSGGGAANIISAGEGWDIDSKFHESHSLAWGGSDGSTYIRENHHSWKGSHQVPVVTDVTEGVLMNKSYSQSGVLKTENIAWNSAGPFPKKFDYNESINDTSGWWSRSYMHTDGAAVPTVTSYSSQFTDTNTVHQWKVDEAAGISSADLTVGNDIGEIKVISPSAEYTFSLTGSKVTIEIAPAAGDTQKITMDGSEIIIDAGATPTAENIKIGGASGQPLATKAFVEQVFKTHMHPTAAPGPPSPPIPLGIETLAMPDGPGMVTNQTIAE